MMFADLAPALPLIESGKVKILAVTARTRSKDMPDVPTIAETVLGYEAEQLAGPVGESGHAEKHRGKNQRRSRRRSAAAGNRRAFQVPRHRRAMGHAGKFRAFIAAESAKWGNVIHAAGIEPQ